MDFADQEETGTIVENSLAHRNFIIKYLMEQIIANVKNFDDKDKVKILSGLTWEINIIKQVANGTLKDPREYFY